MRLDPFEFRQRRLDADREQVREFLLDLADIFLGAELVDKDLDPRLVLVVAPAVAVVDPQAGLGIGDELVDGDEVPDQRGDHRGAAHAAAGVELGTDLPVTLHDAHADVVEPHRRAILLARDHRDLELAGEVGELRVEARPLAHQLGIGAGVHHLVGGSTREVIATDVADAVAAGLDRVHLDRREVRESVGAILQLDPVVLDVLPGGEVAVSAVILVRDVGEHLHLAAVERAIGDGDAQHIGVELEIEPVHQPQRLELVLGQLAFEAAAGLIAEFGDAGIDHRLIV